MIGPMMVETRPIAGAPSLALDNTSLALDYERNSTTRQLETGKHLVEELAIREGERVLDVGCGTGLLAEHIAGIVGPAGSVLGVDPLPLRIGLATSRARDNLAFELGDAYDLERLPDRSFDVVVLNSVFHWLPTKTAPLLSFWRVLRPGGRLGISTVLKDHLTELQRVGRRVLAEPPFDGYPRPRESITFRVDPEEMRALLQTTGFQPLSIVVRDSEHRLASPEVAVRFSEASTFGNLLGHLPGALREQARQRLREALVELMTPDGLLVHNRRIMAVAERR